LKYRKLGNCGVKVSVISIGSWLTFGGGVDNNSGKEILHYAFDKGINLFDTADVYNFGEAEKFLGRNLKRFRRQDLVIATKCFGKMSANINDRGLSRKHVIESAEKSLRNLKTDYIDLLQCHRYDHETPLEETCRAFNTLIEQGKILYWGISEWSREEIENAVNLCVKFNLHKPVCNQPQYNLLSRGIESNGVLDYCRNNGIGLIVWSPLAQGLLTGKYNKKKSEKDSRLNDKKNNVFIKSIATEEKQEKTAELVKIAEENGISASNLALAWCLRHETISSTITSATKLKQLKDNINASEIQLSDEVINKLDLIF